MKAEKVPTGKLYPKYKYRCWKCGELYYCETSAQECCTLKERSWSCGRKKIKYKGGDSESPKKNERKKVSLL